MKTAVIISGQMRTFEHCYPNQRWMVYRHLKNPDFFISCSDDMDASTSDLPKRHYSNVFVEKVEQPEIIEPDRSFCHHSPYQPSTHLQGILKQLWSLDRAWEFFKTSANPDNYAMVVRIRPDLHFHNFVLPSGPLENTCYSPWWSRWGGTNDRVAVLGGRAAPHYFQTFSKLPSLLQLGAPLHPESLIAASLWDGGVDLRTNLQAFFTTVRKDGNHIKPDPQAEDFADLILGLQNRLNYPQSIVET